MSQQVSQSTLFTRLAGKVADAHAATKDAPVQFGNSRLPDGIENGVARLTVMEFGEYKEDGKEGSGYKKGDLFFRAAGVAVSPEYHENIKVAGQQTAQMIPMHDTPTRSKKKKFADHWQDYLNLFKQFQVTMPAAQMPGETKAAADQRIGATLLAAAQHLIKQGIYFRFRTWKGKKKTTGEYANKEPLLNEEWLGITEWTADTAPPAGAVHLNGSAPPTVPTGPPPATATAPAPTAAPSAMAPAPFVEPPQGAQAAPPADVGDANVDALVEMADSDPECVTDDGIAANNQLTAMATAAGLTENDIRGFANFAEVVAAVRARQGGGAAPVAATVATPVKGATVTYLGQPCEVTSVNEGTKTVTLKGPDKKPVLGADKKIAKVAFGELS